MGQSSISKKRYRQRQGRYDRWHIHFFCADYEDMKMAANGQRHPNSGPMKPKEHSRGRRRMLAGSSVRLLRRANRGKSDGDVVRQRVALTF